MAAAQNCSGVPFDVKEYDYEAEIEQIATSLNGLIAAIGDNIFISASDAEHIRSVAGEIMKQVALTRAGISDLLYG